MDAPARIDDRSELVARADGGGGRRTQGAVEETGTIPWKDAECRYQGTYTGGLRDGKPHGKGDFAQEQGRKHLIGEWEGGVKQGRSCACTAAASGGSVSTPTTAGKRSGKASGGTCTRAPVLPRTHNSTAGAAGSQAAARMNE